MTGVEAVGFARALVSVKPPTRVWWAVCLTSTPQYCIIISCLSDLPSII